MLVLCVINPDPSHCTCCRQFQRYGMFEDHMCFKHKDYLKWLWSSAEIPSCSSFGRRIQMRDPAKDAPALASGSPLEVPSLDRPPKDALAPANSSALKVPLY